METGKHAGQPPDLSEAYEERVGEYQFDLTRRQVESDGGLTLHVFGPRRGRVEEILRFDCFREQPHYHLGWSYRDEPFIRIQDPDPFEWALRVLGESFRQLVEEAGAEVERVSNTELKAALERIRDAGGVLEGK